MTPLDAATALFVVAIWGLNFAVVKIGVGEVPPIFYVCLRFALVFALLAPFARWPTGRGRHVAILAVVLGALHFPLMFTGMRLLESGTVSVIAQLQTVFAALLALAMFGERIGVRGWAGMATALAGVAVIAGGVELGAPPWALALPVGGAFFFALYNVLLKKFGRIDGNQLNCWVALAIVPQTLGISLLLEEGQWPALRGMGWGTFGTLLYQAVPMMIVSYWLWYRLLHRYPVTRVAPFMLLMPVFGVGAGWLVLGEAPTLAKLAGAALTVLGVGLMVLRRADPPPASGPAGRPG